MPRILIDEEESESGCLIASDSSEVAMKSNYHSEQPSVKHQVKSLGNAGKGNMIVGEENIVVGDGNMVVVERERGIGEEH